MTQTNSCYESTRIHKAMLTKHAARRAQQRGIPRDAVPLILAYGEKDHDGFGGVRAMMTGKAMEALVRAVGRNQRIDALSGAYVIVSAEDQRTVITVAHQYN